MCQDKWQKIILVYIISVAIGILLFGAQVSGQDNENIAIISTPLPTFEPPTLLQAQLDRPDSATPNAPFAPLAASAVVSRNRVITALADTLITQGYPTANCGDELEMRVGYDTYLDPDGETLHSLIRFNLASISTEATVHSATLWLYLSGSYDYPGHSVPITPYRVSSPWAVDTVTWTSQPTHTESYTPTWVVHGSGVWVPFDVTDLVRHWAAGTYPNYGLVLLDPGAYDEWRAFAASETTAPPHLIILYEQSPDFTLTIVPNVQIVISGQNTSSSSILYLTSTDGFSESTTLDVVGLPPNTSYTWSASPVTPTASTLLTITTTPDTPRGVYTLTITGTSASLVQTTTATLRVLQPDFEMDLQPALQSVWSGQDARYTAHLTATDGFTASVALDIGGLPVNTTYEWAANPVTPTTSTQLTITTAPDTPGGTYTFTITGTANSLVHTAEAVLHVSEPDFEVNLTPPWGSVEFGDDVRYTTYITGVGGFSESVTLDVGGLPPSTTHQWSANPVIPTTTAWLTITTAPDTPGGAYTLTVTGTAGSLIHTSQATLYVSEADFELTLSPSWQSVPSGESARYTAFLTATGGFSQNVTLDIAGLPPDAAYEWSTNPVTPTTSTRLTITTTPDTPSGTYTFTITGTAGSLAHTAQATLSVLNPSFELSLAPPWISVGLEEDAVYTTHLTATDGFSESVALNVDGLPPNVIYQWSVNPITPTASTLLTLTTTSDTPRGVYTFTVTGTAVSLVRAAQATLQVSRPDFELSLRPSQQSIWSGQATSYTAHLTATDGFAAGVLLDVGGLSPNASYEWSANPVTPTSSALLTITTASDTPGGAYTLTITGTAGSLVHTAQAVLNVSEPDFELELVPAWLSIRFGSNARYTAYLTATGGFSKSVAFSVGQLPSNTTYAWSANPVTPTASTWLTITTSPDTPGGLHTITITGTSGSLLHTAQVELHISDPDFDLGITPSWQSVWSGESTQYTAFLTATGEFSQSVVLDIGGLPANTTYEWAANPVTPTAGTQLTITTAPDTPGGTYTFTITGTANSLVHTAEAVLHVSEPDFELNVTPSWNVVGFDDSVRFTTYITRVGGFSESVTLDIVGLPPNTTHKWSANPVTPTTTAWLTITTTPDTLRGTYTLTITGTASSLIHVVQAALHISEPDFELHIEPSLRSVVSGESTHYTAHLVALGGFTGSVTLDVNGVPSNASSMWKSNPIEPTASTVLTIVTTQDTPTGTRSLTVTATSAEIVHSASVSLSVFSKTISETVYLPLILRSYPSGDVTYRPWHTIVGPYQTSLNAVQDAPVSRIALVIGIADYEHMEPGTGTRAGAPGNDLGYTTHDGVKTDSALATRGGFGSSSGGTSMLLLDSQATKAAIHAAIVNWMDPLENKDTVVVIFFSGHGMYAPDDNGDEDDPYDEFLVPYEIEWDSEEARWRYEMAIRDDELDAWLSVLESNYIVVIVDSCFSGGVIETTTHQAKGLGWQPAARGQLTASDWRDGLARDLQSPGRVILAASTEEQSSWEFSALQDGVFTYYLLEAFRSPDADTSDNGWVSAEEAYTYLASRVDAYVWSQVGEHQNPQISDDVSGEVDIVQLGNPPASCPAW